MVLGQSFGGMVAQKYIARHPAHPGKVVISSTSPRMSLERKLAMFEKRGGPQARRLAQSFWSNPSSETFKAYWDGGCRSLYNTQPAADPQAGDRAMFHSDILMHFVGGEMRDMNLAPALANAQCPVLVMAGEEDPVCPMDDALEIVDALPKEWVRFARFANVGHGAWRDDPDAAFAVLRSFIQDTSC